MSQLTKESEALLGTVAALKVSGERVFVLSQGPDGEDKGSTVWVRRVQIGQNGITHQVEIFGVEELEGIQENLVRELDEQVLKGKLQRKIYAAAEKEIAAIEEAEAVVPGPVLVGSKKPN